MVRISVNGVDVNFRIYVGNEGATYFIRKVEPNNWECKRVDNEYSSGILMLLTSVLIFLGMRNSNVVQFSDEGVSLIENTEIDDERQL
ncbi:hypothetical protein GIB67_023339 [Kingdonia uniflora]|uniref:Uncharacterized protein n=1 Tax=Kingdonia uniflora TaxID=39325 RepID=A0A7J7LIH2_9MAGN|nr:hypothetical protein GIB67_023339 [Kingdonia uniflora]